MATEVATAISGVPIRLTDERWRHVVQSHDDLAAYYDDVLRTVEEPQWILRGQGGGLMAVRSFGPRRYLVVVYREIDQTDGFVVTAYFTTRINRRAVVWPESHQ